VPVVNAEKVMATTHTKGRDSDAGAGLREISHAMAGTKCIAWMPKKCGTRRSPPLRDQLKRGSPFASVVAPPTQ